MYVIACRPTIVNANVDKIDGINSTTLKKPNKGTFSVTQ
jgi:hypothetical protein